MAKILDNCKYDKIKLLHELSCISWFIQKHGKEDAKTTGDTECHAAFEELQKDLEKHIAKLEKMLCTCK